MLLSQHKEEKKTWGKLDALFPDLHLPTPLNASRLIFCYLDECVWDFLEVSFLFGHGSRLKMATLFGQLLGQAAGAEVC